ncbi:unnamed protein product, partial [Polarella glacialis]
AINENAQSTKRSQSGTNQSMHDDSVFLRGHFAWKRLVKRGVRNSQKQRIGNTQIMFLGSRSGKPLSAMVGGLFSRRTRVSPVAFCQLEEGEEDNGSEKDTPADVFLHPWHFREGSLVGMHVTSKG